MADLEPPPIWKFQTHPTVAKYILAVNGEKKDVKCAAQVISRKRKRKRRSVRMTRCRNEGFYLSLALNNFSSDRSVKVEQLCDGKPILPYWQYVVKG